MKNYSSIIKFTHCISLLLIDTYDVLCMSYKHANILQVYKTFFQLTHKH